MTFQNYSPKMQSYPNAESIQHKRQLIFVFRFEISKSGNRDSEQPYRLLWRHQLLQQLERSVAESMTRTDLLRVINSKSENFTLSVAVRPRAPVVSQ